VIVMSCGTLLEKRLRFYAEANGGAVYAQAAFELGRSNARRKMERGG